MAGGSLTATGCLRIFGVVKCWWNVQLKFWNLQHMYIIPQHASFQMSSIIPTAGNYFKRSHFNNIENSKEMPKDN